MTYSIIKALHLIFVITWFAGLFYIVRLFIYSAEANALDDEDKKQTLLDQFKVMQRRLWYGITWPSAILTFVLGLCLLYLYGAMPGWLILKLGLLVFLYLYHYSCHLIYKQQQRYDFKYSPFILRIWNEVATLLLFAIIFTVILKQLISSQVLLLGILLLSLLLFLSIWIYKKRREGGT